MGRGPLALALDPQALGQAVRLDVAYSLIDATIGGTPAALVKLGVHVGHVPHPARTDHQQPVMGALPPTADEDRVVGPEGAG